MILSKNLRKALYLGLSAMMMASLGAGAVNINAHADQYHRYGYINLSRSHDARHSSNYIKPMSYGSFSFVKDNYLSKGSSDWAARQLGFDKDWPQSRVLRYNSAVEGLNDGANAGYRYGNRVNKHAVNVEHAIHHPYLYRTNWILMNAGARTGRTDLYEMNWLKKSEVIKSANLYDKDYAAGVRLHNWKVSHAKQAYAHRYAKRHAKRYTKRAKRHYRKHAPRRTHRVHKQHKGHWAKVWVK